VGGRLPEIMEWVIGYLRRGCYIVHAYAVARDSEMVMAGRSKGEPAFPYGFVYDRKEACELVRVVASEGTGY